MSSNRIAGEAIWSCGAKGLTKLVLGFVFSQLPNANRLKTNPLSSHPNGQQALEEGQTGEWKRWLTSQLACTRAECHALQVLSTLG